MATSALKKFLVLYLVPADVCAGCANTYQTTNSVKLLGHMLTQRDNPGAKRSRVANG